MGLFQRAVETYDNMSHLSGVVEEGKEPLAPIGHITAEPKIEITIDDEGNFIEAKRIEASKGEKKNQKIIIPVTESSVARSSTTIAPHALCDKIEYLWAVDALSDIEKNKYFDKLIKDFNEDEKSKKKIDESKKATLEAELFDIKKYNEYLTHLEEWFSHDPDNKKINSILTYIKKKTLFKDLCDHGLIKLKLTEKKMEVKDLVCWRVNGLGEKSGPVWTDKELFDSFQNFYESQNKDEAICMVSGNWNKKAKQHIKGIYSKNGNAMLISANDTSNYTYLGRFLDKEEALTISYDSSQKAHNVLKWLISNQGVIEGERVFICWNPNGYELPKINSPLLSSEDNNNKSPIDYKEDLKKKIEGYQKKLALGKSVIVASFDAATTGRLSVTYYNELTGSDFLDRLEYWDKTCCWYSSRYGTSSPTLYNIIKFIFGVQRGSEVKSNIEVDNKDKKIIGVYMERLIKCRVDKSLFPVDIMRALFNKANNLQILNMKNKESLLFTTCAVVRKYYIDRFKEKFDMALEKDKKDRSYQYGRLLAVMEKAEFDTYDEDERNKRQTNAMRMQSVFVKRPEYATRIILEQLKQAYYPKLKGKQAVYYEKLIGEIHDKLSECTDEREKKSLNEKYILGYYLQKNELYKKKEEKSIESEEQKDEQI